jgi:hypothetical protein
MAVDQSLLAKAAAIDALRERLGAVRDSVDQLPKHRQARDDADPAILHGDAHCALRTGLADIAALQIARKHDSGIAMHYLGRMDVAERPIFMAEPL